MKVEDTDSSFQRMGGAKRDYTPLRYLMLVLMGITTLMMIMTLLTARTPLQPKSTVAFNDDGITYNTFNSNNSTPFSLHSKAASQQNMMRKSKYQMLQSSLALDFDDFIEQKHGQVNQCLSLWPEEKANFDQIFKYMDTDLDNHITRAEFEAFYRKYEPTISDATIQSEFNYVDFNQNGRWSKREVCEGFIETRSQKVGELNDGQTLILL